MNKEKTLKENLGEIAIGLLKAVGKYIYGNFAYGFLLYKWMFWFIYPVFNESPYLTYFQCVGLTIFIGLFKTYPVQIIKKEYTRTEWEVSFTKFIFPWITLGLSYLTYLIVK